MLAILTYRGSSLPDLRYSEEKGPSFDFGGPERCNGPCAESRRGGPDAEYSPGVEGKAYPAVYAYYDNLPPTLRRRM